MKRIIILIFIFHISFLGFSQKEINTEWKNYINPIFENLDKSKVPMGVLLDYAMEFTNLEAYNGTLTDSTYVDIDVFSNIYKTLFMGKVTSDTIYFPRIHNIAYNWSSARVSENSNEKNTLILAGLFYKYAKINTNAKYQNKINVKNNTYEDVYINGIWQDPYETGIAIAFSLPVLNYNKRVFNIKLPKNMFLGNLLPEISKIEINPNDGLGYRNVKYDEDIIVKYPYNGEYDIVFKVTLADGNQILYTHTKIKINQQFKSKDWRHRHN